MSAARAWPCMQPPSTTHAWLPLPTSPWLPSTCSPYACLLPALACPPAALSNCAEAATSVGLLWQFGVISLVNKTEGRDFFWHVDPPVGIPRGGYFPVAVWKQLQGRDGCMHARSAWAAPARSIHARISLSWWLVILCRTSTLSMISGTSLGLFDKFTIDIVV